MLNEIDPPIQGLILDMDGVLWKDSSPIGDLPAIFDHIRALGLRVCLATNNATITVQEYLAKMQRFGVSLLPEEIVTSATVAANTLLKRFPQKGAVYVVGELGMITALSEAGFSPITDAEDATPVVAVVAGLDRGLTYQKLRRATAHVRGGAVFYGTNPDPTLPTPEGLIPGSGSILAALEAATERKAIVIGKPAPSMFQLSLERMRLKTGDVLIVGDRLETDIAGGQAFGARTGLVLSGASTAADAKAWNPQPDLIANDLTELVGA